MLVKALESFLDWKLLLLLDLLLQLPHPISELPPFLFFFLSKRREIIEESPILEISSGKECRVPVREIPPFHSICKMGLGGTP